MSNLKAYITVIGQTIIAEEKDQTGTHYRLEGAFFFGPQQDPETGKVGMGYTPISPVAPGNPVDGLKFSLQKAHVLVTHAVSDAAAEAYNRVTGKIQVAPASAIVELDTNRKKK
jgi:hypothetical protein